MTTLLFEIGCEELPASACDEAERQLPAVIRRNLGEEGRMRVLVGPRRLAVLVEGVPEREADRVERRRGPSEAIAFGEAGPTKAADGLALSHGMRGEL